MIRDARDYLVDILRSIDEVLEFTRGFTFEDFIVDVKTRNAVIRSLEVLGEATKQIPDVVRERANSVPWKRMAGMRDKLIHEYFGIDLGIVWVVVNEELPPLRPNIENLLAELSQQIEDS